MEDNACHEHDRQVGGQKQQHPHHLRILHSESSAAAPAFEALNVGQLGRKTIAQRPYKVPRGSLIVAQ